MAHVLVDKYVECYPDYEALHLQMDEWLQKAQRLCTWDAAPVTIQQGKEWLSDALDMQTHLGRLAKIALDEIKQPTFVGLCQDDDLVVSVEDAVRTVYLHEPRSQSMTLNARFSMHADEKK